MFERVTGLPVRIGSSSQRQLGVPWRRWRGAWWTPACVAKSLRASNGVNCWMPGRLITMVMRPVLLNLLLGGTLNWPLKQLSCAGNRIIESNLFRAHQNFCPHQSPHSAGSC